jgi:hypothetical protein
VGEAGSDPKVEIAHVLTIDAVGYSTLFITEQSYLMAELTRIVKEMPRFRRAEADGKLIRIPTGDGMLLVFFDDPQAPIECAIEISSAMKNHPDIQLRMGIHSGPVHEVLDVNERANVAGAGIDIAQRVMDCGDAGHILLSKRVADDLTPYARWNAHLHELGECEIKHGRKISLVNFYTNEIGNPEPPAKYREPKQLSASAAERSASAASLPRAKRPLFAGLAFMVTLCRRGVCFLPDKDLPVVEKRGRGADKYSFHCCSAVRKREQRSERGISG